MNNAKKKIADVHFSAPLADLTEMHPECPGDLSGSANWCSIHFIRLVSSIDIAYRVTVLIVHDGPDLPRAAWQVTKPLT